MSDGRPAGTAGCGESAEHLTVLGGLRTAGRRGPKVSSSLRPGSTTTSDR